jgi:hypothetical protein
MDTHTTSKSSIIMWPVWMQVGFILGVLAAALLTISSRKQAFDVTRGGRATDSDRRT